LGGRGMEGGGRGEEGGREGEGKGLWIGDYERS